MKMFLKGVINYANGLPSLEVTIRSLPGGGLGTRAFPYRLKNIYRKTMNMTNR
jgi:hypothetical protein